MLELPERLNYENQSVAWGTIGDGPSLVLIHGTPFSSQVWRKIAPLLARRWKVYYYDLIGYGQSEMKAEQDVSLGVQNTLLCHLLKEWGLEDPEILCHDFGGATALRAHYIDQINFKTLTLIDPVAIAPWGSPFVQHVRQHEAAFTGLPDYMHHAVLDSYLQTASFIDLPEETLSIYRKPWTGSTGQPAFYRQIAQMSQTYTDEIEKWYSPMNFPVKILWGDLDKWIPVSQGVKLANRLTNGQLRIVKNSGHLMQEDAPEAVVAEMFGTAN